MASLAFKIFLAVCLLTCFAIQAQGRPGKPFYACKSYIVSISFSLSNFNHRKEQGHAHLVMPFEEGKLDVYKQEFNEEPNHVVFESWRFTDNYNPFQRFTNNYNPIQKFNNNDNPFHQTKPYDHQRKRMSNFQKRARDILSILIALLLGALCGAITSTIFHVVWSLATNRYALLNTQEDGAAVDPQEFGYEKLPTKEGVKVEAK